MRKGDTRGSSRQGLQRRRYLQALVGASVAGIAGCSGESGDGNGDGNVTLGGSGGTGASAGTAGGGATSDAITVTAANVPSQSNLNPWAATTKATGMTWMTEITGPDYVIESTQLLSGHSYDTPWIDGTDSISVPTMIEDVEINPPYEIVEHHDDRITYWDGTPMDAEARLLDDKVEYYYNGNAYDDSSTFNYEVVDQWTYKRWNDKGEVEGQEANPTNEFILQAEAIPSNEPPMHPGFTRPYAERYEDASSQETIDQISEELGGETISFSRFAEEGWGSGLYSLDPADISSTSALATLREDHPNDHATIPNLEVRFATTDRIGVLIDQGEVDIGGGIVQEQGGSQSRNSLPDHIQEVQRYRQSGGDQILFNWNNTHLGRLWVRRAIVAAVDWNAVGSNGWGAERSVPIENQTGLLDAAAESTFSEEFLGNLHTYPMGPDLELAREYLRKAGYSQQGNGWVGPDGNQLSLSLKFASYIADYVGATQTMKANLESLGATVQLQGLSSSAYTEALKMENLDYDMMMFWAGNPYIWDSYWTDGHWYAQQLLGGDPDDAPGWHVTPEDETDAKGRPLDVQIPSQVGSIAAPDQAGTNPSLSNGTDIDIAAQVHRFREADLSREGMTDAAEMCARYYNFYLPDFKFHQYNWGLWGNVRDFSFPPTDHKANLVTKGFSGDDYEVLGGIVQTKEDDQYPAP